MVKKYKLLKDLPGLKAGAISSGERIITFFSKTSVKTYKFSAEEVVSNPEWFEEVTEHLFTQDDMLKAYMLGFDRVKCTSFTELIKNTE